MRLAIASLAVLGFAAPALAQQSGSVALDATTAYGRTFGAGFYVSDHLSLRPSLGFGYSGTEGAFFNLGSEVRWDFHNQSRFTPYTAASFNYMRTPYLSAYDPSGLAAPERPLQRHALRRRPGRADARLRPAVGHRRRTDDELGGPRRDRRARSPASARSRTASTSRARWACRSC